MHSDNFSQNEPFTIAGQWWLPGKKRGKVAGELRHRDGNLSLRLFGALHKATRGTWIGSQPEETHVDVIYGESFFSHAIPM